MRERTRAADARIVLDAGALARDLSPRERGELRAALAALLGFHRTLARWPALPRAPRATPIVAVYAGGVLRGCAMGRGDRAPAERVARAFLAAAADAREDAPLAVELSYPRSVRWIDDPTTLEIGTEGVALIRRGAAPVLLMPQVARDHGVDARGLLALLADKAGLAVDLWAHRPAGARLAAWTVHSIVARLDDRPRVRRGDVEAASARAAARSGARAADYAAAWLARMIDARGAVAFALDPRARVLQPDGDLWHARSAIAVEALAAHGGYPREVARARRWLGAEIRRALHGGRVARWPAERAAVAGTLALACLAGVPVHDALHALVARGRWRRLATSPGWAWHAGQVAAALGSDTPQDLWAACVAALARRPFAPYVALAASARGDAPALRRAGAAVAGYIRRVSPHRGGARATELPETGLTAVAAHALAVVAAERAAPRGAALRTARDAALAFVRARQLLPARIPAPLDPTLALGGFAASPIDDVLRADIAGHALLALLAP